MVPIIGNEACNADGWYNGKIDNTMICAGYEEGGRDSCQVYTDFIILNIHFTWQWQ